MVDQVITVIGTEAFHNEKSDSDALTIMRQLSDWWTDQIAHTDGKYETEFTYSYTEIPESAIENQSTLRNRRRRASEWLSNNYVHWDSRASMQILDWIEKDGDGWPFGQADIGSALTDDVYRTGITNVWSYEQPGMPSFFTNLGESGTTFHELLHNYSAGHEHGAVNMDGEASFIHSKTLNEDDDTCYWSGDRDVRTAWTCSCTNSIVYSHIDDNS